MHNFWYAEPINVSNSNTAYKDMVISNYDFVQRCFAELTLLPGSTIEEFDSLMRFCSLNLEVIVASCCFDSLECCVALPKISSLTF